MVLMLEFFRDSVVSDGLICSIDNLVISEDTALAIDGNGHFHNHYKIDITKFMTILLLVVVLRYFSL